MYWQNMSFCKRGYLIPSHVQNVLVMLRAKSREREGAEEKQIYGSAKIPNLAVIRSNAYYFVSQAKIPIATKWV